MSRLQTQFQFNTPGLQPASRPVDTFVQPSAKPTYGPNDLAQVANALRSVEPGLNAIIERQTAAEIEGLQARAIKDASQMQLKNQAALKAAVDAGKLPEYSNPWYQVSLRQEVAKSEVATAKDEIWNEYLQSPERHSEDLGAVQKFFSERFAKLGEGRDAWEMQVIAPAARNLQESFLQAHVNQRDDERQLEMEIGTKRSLSEAMNLLSSKDVENLQSEDPALRQAAQQKQALAQNKLTALLTEKGRVVNKAKLEAWAVDVAANATAQGKPGLGQALLSGLPTFDGKSDLGQAYSGQLERADEHALDMQVHKMERQERIEGLADKKAIDDVEKKFFTEWDKYIQENPKATAADVLANVTIPVSDLNPRARMQLEHLKQYMTANQDKASQDDRTSHLLRMFGDVVNNPNPDLDKSRVSLLQATTALQSPHLWPFIEQGLSAMSRSKDVDTDPATVAELRQKWGEGTLEITDVLTAAPKLSNRDQEIYMGRAKENSLEKHADQSDQISLAKMQIQSAIYAKAVHAEDADEETKFRLQQESKVGLSNAETELTQGMISISKDKALSPVQKDQEREKLVNGLLKKYTGHDSYNAFLQSEDKLRQKKEEALKNPPKAAPAPMDADAFGGEGKDDPDPAFKGVTREHTDAAKWAFHAKVEVPKGQTLPGNYPWFTSNSASRTVRMWYDYTSSLRVPAKSGYDYNPDPKHKGEMMWFPNLKAHYATKEIEERDSAMQNLPDLQARAELALKNWKNRTETVSQRLKSGSPFLTFDEKVDIVNDTNTAAQLAFFRKVFGYKPEEVKALGADAWQKYRVFMNDYEMEDPARLKAVATKLGVPNDKIQAFMIAQRTLIERDVRTAEHHFIHD